MEVESRANKMEYQDNAISCQYFRPEEELPFRICPKCFKWFWNVKEFQEATALFDVEERTLNWEEFDGKRYEVMRGRLKIGVFQHVGCGGKMLDNGMLEKQLVTHSKAVDNED